MFLFRVALGIEGDTIIFSGLRALSVISGWRGEVVGVSQGHSCSPLGRWQGTVVQNPLTKEAEVFSTRPGSGRTLLCEIYLVKLCAFLGPQFLHL